MYFILYIYQTHCKGGTIKSLIIYCNYTPYECRGSILCFSQKDQKSYKKPLISSQLKCSCWNSLWMWDPKPPNRLQLLLTCLPVSRAHTGFFPSPPSFCPSAFLRGSQLSIHDLHRPAVAPPELPLHRAAGPPPTPEPPAQSQRRGGESPAATDASPCVGFKSGGILLPYRLVLKLNVRRRMSVI